MSEHDHVEFPVETRQKISRAAICGTGAFFAMVIGVVILGEAGVTLGDKAQRGMIMAGSWAALTVLGYLLFKPDETLNVRRTGDGVRVRDCDLPVAQGAIRVEEVFTRSNNGGSYSYHLYHVDEAGKSSLASAHTQTYARRLAEAICRVGEYEFQWMSAGEVQERKPAEALDRPLVDRFDVRRGGSGNGLTVSGVTPSGEQVEGTVDDIVERTREFLDDRGEGRVEEARPGRVEVEWAEREDMGGMLALGAMMVTPAVVDLLAGGSIADGEVGTAMLYVALAVGGLGLLADVFFSRQSVTITPESVVHVREYAGLVPGRTEVATDDVESVLARTEKWMGADPSTPHENPNRARLVTDTETVPLWIMPVDASPSSAAMLVALGATPEREVSEGGDVEW